MAEEPTDGTPIDTGITADGTQGTEPTGTAPVDDGGQPAATPDGGTTSSGTQPEDTTFFDPKSLSPELMPAYKNMQGAFTKRMQDLAKQREKVEAYDAFYNNPTESLNRLAQQLGYNVVPANQQGQQPQPGQTDQNWEPKSWDEVLDRAKQVAKQELLQEFKPVIEQVQGMRQESIERTLAEIDPAWQQYEDSMRQNLKMHPTLAGDPATLYRLSVPPEVLESRATQKALEKLEAKGKATQVSGSSTTKQRTGGLPEEPVSFQDAVKAAKRKLAEDGITPGG